MDRARHFVERRLDAQLSLDDLADVACLSPYHFSRQFTARFGFSPMAYVRARRLEIAAERLRAGPQISLIDLALDCGFDSQEGFTRAFPAPMAYPPAAIALAHGRPDRSSSSWPPPTCRPQT